MALGAITPTAKVKQAPIFVDHLAFAGDGAYPTGGTADFEGLFQAALEAAGRSSPGREILSISQVDASGYVLRYDKANDKLMVFYGDNNNAADGPLIEVPNATDLSAQAFRVIVYSK